MFVRLVQLPKAQSPMLVTLSGIVILVRLVQPLKALLPILVTPLPIVMLVRLVHLSKAQSPMLVTGLPSMVSGIINSPVAASLQSVMVTSPLFVIHDNTGTTCNVSPFQSLPLSPKELRASIVTKATAPSDTPENALLPTVGATP